MIELLLAVFLLAPVKKPAPKPTAPAPAAPAKAPLRMPRNILPRPTAPPAPLTTTMTLVIKTAAGEVRADAAKPPPAGERPTAVLKSGEKPQVRWQIKNTDPRKPVSNMVVHFLITREAAAGTPIPAGPQRGSWQDSVLGTDFGPHEGTSGEYRAALYEPGYYLVELEILDETGARRQYCALDLKVE